MSSRPDAEAERLDPDEPPAAPDERPPARGRGDPRRDARRLRPARPRRCTARASPPHLTPFMDGRGRPRPPARSTATAGGASTSTSAATSSTRCSSPSTSPPRPRRMGRRNVSNVPAQALTLMNDPFVVDQARLWADRVLAETGGRRRANASTRLYATAFGRPPDRPRGRRGPRVPRRAGRRLRPARRPPRLGRPVPRADQRQRVHLSSN